MSMLWGMRDSIRIRQASAAADTATARAQRADTRTQDLEVRLEKLTLVCSAMWELLAERAELTEADLLDKVQDIDLRDGHVDGKMTKTANTCPQCGRVMSPRHAKCMYCGAADLSATAFDATL